MPCPKAMRFHRWHGREPPHPATSATGRLATAPLAMQSQPPNHGQNRPQPLAGWR